MYVMAITYSFDGSYVAKKFDTYKEALQHLYKYLNEEISQVRLESDFEPSVLRWSEDDITLVYAEGFSEDDFEKNYCKEDCAYYRVFEID